MKYAIIAFDPQVGIYKENDQYGVEIVEADNKEEALQISELGNLNGLMFMVNECSDDMEIGECEVSDIVYEEEKVLISIALLKKAIRCIERLADQQAMPDDFYQTTLQKLKDILLILHNG